jgi:site-specific recombinase XerD
MPKHRGWVLSERRFLSRSEVEALRAFALRRVKQSRWRRRSRVMEWIVMELALNTGLRVREIAWLRCGDLFIQPEGGSVLVRQGKGNKSRLVKFGRSMARTLERYLEWKAKRGERTEAQSPLLLSSHTSRTLTSRALQKMFTRLARQLAIEGHSFHTLRHTYATHLHRASGNNLRLVQKQLGHASIRTTQVYAGVFDEETERAVNNLYV